MLEARDKKKHLVIEDLCEGMETAVNGMEIGPYFDWKLVPLSSFFFILGTKNFFLRWFGAGKPWDRKKLNHGGFMWRNANCCEWNENWSVF